MSKARWRTNPQQRRTWQRWQRGVMVVGAALVVLPVVSIPTASAAPAPVDPEASLPPATEPELPPAVPEDERDKTLGPQWDSSGDRAWMTSGDAEGLHVLTADAATGYEWQEVATLAETGFVTDMWIGNACLTGSGKRLAITYAPRNFTNEDALFDRGGFTAVVDLDTGAVTKLDLLSSLAYYSPGCGTGEQVLFTQEGGELGRTRIVAVETADSSVQTPIEIEGQLTSAVPTPAGIVAADDGALVRVDADGARTPLVQTHGTAFELAPDAEGGVVFLEAAGERAEVSRLTPEQSVSGPQSSLPEPTALGSGGLTDVGVATAAAGEVYVTGEFAPTTTLPPAVHDADVPKDAAMSTDGDVAVDTRGRAASETPAGAAPGTTDPTEQTEEVAVEIESLTTGETTSVLARMSTTTTGVADQPSPALRGMSLQGSPTDPVEDERTCAVPVNDAANQALQPKPRQVEWAVDQAVTGSLTAAGSPKHALRSGRLIGATSDYYPQAMFPSIPLKGGGRVPAQVFLGILAQESNLWQAPGYVVPGVTGSPLVGNFYGLDLYNVGTADDFTIMWDDADCGYGVAQVTDGMRLAGKENGGVPAYSREKQRAVALDYVTNIAAGLRILQDKWNQTYDAGLRINNGDPSKIENWFYAIWAYNSGFHPQSAAAENNGAWGVGWANNPANPRYPANRDAFLDNSYADAKTPQKWPYPEKVLGWAGHPIDSLESPDTRVAGYRAAWWGGATGPGAGADSANARRTRVKPPVNQFCDATNSCTPGQKIQPTGPDVVDEPAGPCGHKDSWGRYDLKCWANTASTWKPDCNASCGNELLRFDPGWEYQPDGKAYLPNCSRLKSSSAANGLRSTALIVDDLPTGTRPIRGDCASPVASAGTFALHFGNDERGNFPSKTDFHQLGAGFNGHFYFAHTRQDDVRNDSMEITGTWTLGKELHQWTRVMVHMPDHGAHTQQATYTVDTGMGKKTRVVLQRTQANKWVSLGVFEVNGTPSVTLTSVTDNGDPDSLDIDNDNYAYKNEDIAFDAVAFDPLTRKPDQFVVAMGDSYSSGEGASATGGVDYYKETDNNGNDKAHRNACHRSPHAWSRQGTFAGTTSTIGTRADEWDPTLDYQMLACSGAQTEQLLPDTTVPQGQPRVTNAFGEDGTGQYGELSQIDRGFLDENTTLVTVSIGGNDARFSNVIMECMIVGQCYNMPLPGEWTQSMRTTAEELIPGDVASSIKIALQQIHLRAPNAKIVLMGYPEIFTPRLICNVAIPGDEVEFLNEMARLLADAMAGVAQDLNQELGRVVVRFSNPIDEFSGQSACGDPETIHGMIDTRTPGEPTTGVGGKMPSQQSYHPKISGQLNYARSFNSTLREFGW